MSSVSRSNGFMTYSSAPASSAARICAMSFSVVQNTTFGWSLMAALPQAAAGTPSRSSPACSSRAGPRRASSVRSGERLAPVAGLARPRNQASRGYAGQPCGSPWNRRRSNRSSLRTRSRLRFESLLTCKGNEEFKPPPGLPGRRSSLPRRPAAAVRCPFRPCRVTRAPSPAPWRRGPVMAPTWPRPRLRRDRRSGHNDDRRVRRPPPRGYRTVSDVVKFQRAMQSMTVRTRLRRAESPATWAAARGTGISVSSSTTASTAAACKATRSPAIVTTSRRLVHLAAPAEARWQRSAARLDRSDRYCPILAPRSGSLRSQINAIRSWRLPAFLRKATARLARSSAPSSTTRVAGGFDDRAKHVLHPWISRQSADTLFVTGDGAPWWANSQCASSSSAGSPSIKTTPADWAGYRRGDDIGVNSLRNR